MDTRVILLLTLFSLFALWLLWCSELLKGPWALLNSVILIALAMAVRGAFLSYETLDYQDFLSKWVDFFRQNGGFSALKYEVGNYNIPYLYFLAAFSYSDIYDLYLIKLLSVFFDIILAWSAAQIVGHFVESIPARLGCFFAVLFMPTVLLNGSLWAQCDSSYVALALLGICFAYEDRPCLSMICASLSFGFKLQAVFILPIYAVFWMQGRFKLRHFLLFPLCYLLLVLPAILLGRPFMDTILLYFNQTGSIGDGLNYNSPSVYAYLPYDFPAQYNSVARIPGLIAAFVYMFVLLGICYVNRKRLNDKAVLILTLLFAVGIPFLLPHMHDRYFFGTDVLALVLAFVMPMLASLPLLAQFASLLGYHAYLRMRYLLLMHHGANALVAVLLIGFTALYLSFDKKSGEEEKLLLDKSQ